MTSLVWLALVPRVETVLCPPGPPACTTVKPGTVLRMSGRLRPCWVAISLSVTTVIDRPASAAGVAMPVGLAAAGATGLCADAALRA